jgi:endo-1,4-beta-mannosidase
VNSDPGATFRLGVNYWPARTAMRWWTIFDPDEVRADFERIAGAGMDSVRIFCTWEDFQPDPRSIDHPMLERLITVADIAADVGLGLMPTLFTGHMSGVNWIPGWALGSRETGPRFRVVSGTTISHREIRCWFTDRDVTDAQQLLAGESAQALAGHPALWAWDLGNENSNCAVPPDRSSGRAWLGRMAGAIRSADDATAITIGLHMEDLEQDRRIGPAEAAEACDFLTMHGYPIYAPWAAGPTDEHLLGFLTQVTRWLGGDTDLLFSEFGLPTTHAEKDVLPMLVEESVAADYTARALDDLRRAGATGAMLWCANDYDPAIWNDPPLDEAAHERSFGLWHSDGSAKPSVATLTAAAGNDVLAGPTDRSWIDIEPHEFFTAAGSHLPRLYQRYRATLTNAGSGD